MMSKHGKNAFTFVTSRQPVGNGASYREREERERKIEPKRNETLSEIHSTRSGGSKCMDRIGNRLKIMKMQID